MICDPFLTERNQIAELVFGTRHAASNAEFSVIAVEFQRAFSTTTPGPASVCLSDPGAWRRTRVCFSGISLTLSVSLTRCSVRVEVVSDKISLCEDGTSISFLTSRSCMFFTLRSRHSSERRRFVKKPSVCP